MKFTQRGFTLIELMIVIAIIGILAVALFPSISNYIERGRDAARASHLKDIVTAIGTYYSDFEKYPVANPSNNGCLNSGALTTVYLPSFPIDPKSTNQNGCGANGIYGYATGTGYGTSPQFIVTSSFETDWGGNINNNGSTSVTSLVQTGVFYLLQRTTLLDVAGAVRKGNGSGYIMYK